MSSVDALDDIGQRCLGAAIAGGETWQQFMADAEERTGLTWSQIKDLLNERYADKIKATV